MLAPKRRVDGIGRSHEYSVIVYPGDRYAAVPGDWRGISSDGCQRCGFVSGHANAAEAAKAAGHYCLNTRQEDESDLTS